MSNIVFTYSFMEPESIETIDDSHAFEGVLHLNLFISENHFEPKVKDIEELSFHFTVSFSMVIV